MKEVIHPHLPVGIPCYDFRLVTNPTVGISLQKVNVLPSSRVNFQPVTGGVYKARERIHRRIADRRLLAIPASCRRVAAYNPNWGKVCQIRLPSRVCFRLSLPLYYV